MAVLDYALFQLTPTRTRCDLVLFYGGKNEKLASGLFEPFVSHLNSAKDQISKGGYSIKLSPPTAYAPWFTKATFERFVRFVSTPAVLERFVSLEKEILQIESSAQANELANASMNGQLEEENGSAANSRKSSESLKTKGEEGRSNGASQEENSKIQLQRLLETRKTLLRKEQAMAYARGLVAGFDPDNIDDLISFADAFGASRLREACINFKDLCKKKRGDGLWMQELAAMEAYPPAELSFLGTSGIVINNDASTLNPNITLNLQQGGSDITSHASSDGKKDENSATPNQMPMQWPNQMPQYMYNFPNPMQQLPPYQGYPFPIPPHYAMNMQWPTGPVKREKSRKKKGSEDSGEDEETASSDSEVVTGSDSERLLDKSLSSKDSSHRKKSKKKSSKTVVIRNINYITPRRNGVSDESSDEEDIIDEDSIRQQVDDAVGSLEKAHRSKSSSRKKKGSHKSNGISNGSDDASAQDDHSDQADGQKTSENWGAFQSLLLRDEESTDNGVERFHPMDPQDGHYGTRGLVDANALAIVPALDFESEKVPKQKTATGDAFIVSQRNGGSGERGMLEDLENAENHRSLVKRRDYTDGDLVIPQRMEESGNGLGGILASESPMIKPGKGEDWFVVSHSQLENGNSTNKDVLFNDASINIDKSRKDVVIDDSFMVHARPAVDDVYDSQWKTDISMDADFTVSSQPENGSVRDSYDSFSAREPDDLYVVLDRDSGFDPVRESWTSDHGIDISFMETERRSSAGEPNNDADKKLTSNGESEIVKKEETKGRKVPGKDARSKVTPGYSRSRIDMLAKSRKPSIQSRPLMSKQEREEEMRRKVEELALERQKRIAERSAAAAKKNPSDSKQVKGTTKNKPHSATQQTNKVSSIKVRAA